MVVSVLLCIGEQQDKDVKMVGTSVALGDIWIVVSVVRRIFGVWADVKESPRKSAYADGSCPPGWRPLGELPSFTAVMMRRYKRAFRDRPWAVCEVPGDYGSSWLVWGSGGRSWCWWWIWRGEVHGAGGNGLWWCPGR